MNFCTDNLKCGDRNHTMCFPDEISSTCSANKYKKLVMDSKTIRNIVMGHNGLRNRLATDEVNSVSDMLYLVRE